MTHVEYNPKDFDIMIGLDVDFKKFAINVKNHSTMNRLLTMPAKPEAFGGYIRRTFAGQRVLCAYEAGPTGFGLHDYLTSQNIPCLMVSPLSIPKASNARVKNNRIDAQKIAQHLRTGDLKPIRVPDEPYRQLRHLVRTREDYARQLRATKQRIKSLLLAQSLHALMQEPEQHWSNRYISQLKELPCVGAVRYRLDMLLEDLAYHRKQSLRILKELKDYCEQAPDIQKNIGYLRSIPGIGFVIASTVLGNIGDPVKLRNPRELAGFIGLVPCEYSTGDKVIKGSITHLGDASLRSLLIQAAWVTIRHDQRLASVYHRIRNRHPAGVGARKAIVAVARKLTLIIYRVLKDQRDYIRY